MPIPFYKYSEIKDNYCFSYFGPCNEYIHQLLYIRHFLEEKFKGTNIYIACRPELCKEKNMVSKIEKETMACIKEITCDMKTHPIHQIIKECKIDLPKIKEKINNYTKCAICPKNNLTGKTFNDLEIHKIKRIATSRGYDPIVTYDLSEAGLVIGQDNEFLYQAALEGIKTILVNCHISKSFYKELFSPPGEFLEVK